MSTEIPLHFYPALSPTIEDQLYFLNRLGNLQWLCSSTIEEDNESSPQSLLFILGVDGKNNKLSNKILSFLFPLLSTLTSSNFNYLEYNNNEKLTDFLKTKKKKQRIFYNKKENKKFSENYDEEEERRQIEFEESEERKYEELFDLSESELNEIILQNILNDLEETVLLIKEGSLSFLYTEKIQKLLSNYLKNVKNFYLNEYVIKHSDSHDLDLLQYQKIFYFKQLMLMNETSVTGSDKASTPSHTIGVPLTPGYYHVNEELERFPLIQAFALDHIYTSTGFFTMRYNVCDLTSVLNDIILKQITGSHLEELMQTLDNDHLKYYTNLIKIIQTSGTKRQALTAAELVEPLELLYEFNLLSAGESEDEMDDDFRGASLSEETKDGKNSDLIPFNIKNIYKPWVLLGSDTQMIVSPKLEYEYRRGKWRNTQLKNSPICVVENNIKMSRFCRTIFFTQGVFSSLLKQEKRLKEALAGIENHALVEEILAANALNQQLYTNTLNHSSAALQAASPLSALEMPEDDDYLYEISQIQTYFNTSKASLEKELRLLNNFNRYYRLYLKLWYNLRLISLKVMMENFDVLNAGNQIKSLLTSVMSSSSSFSSHTQDSEDFFNLSVDHSVKLEGNEKLSLHIDCMANNGSIISIDEIDELGGACYVYVRASICNIEMETCPSLAFEEIRDESKTDGSASDKFMGTISIGDTFLFSPLNTYNKYPSTTIALAPHITDSICLTGCIPYLTLFSNNNLELNYAECLTRCLKNAGARNILGLQESKTYSSENISGSILPANPFTASNESAASGILSKLSVSLLTNNIDFPHLQGEVSLFSSGFLMNFQSGNFLTNHASNLTLPLLVSFLYDVESFSVINSLDYYEDIVTQIEEKDSLKDGSTSVNIHNFIKSFYKVDTLYPAIPEGLVLIFNLRKESTAFERLFPLHSSASPSSLHSNKPKTLAICIENSDLYLNSFTLILDLWRTSLRRKNIVEIKSLKEFKSLKSIPKFSFLRELQYSFLVYLNSKVLHGYNTKLARRLSQKNQGGALSLNFMTNFYAQEEKKPEQDKETEVIDSYDILQRVTLLNELFGSSEGNSFPFLSCLHDNFSHFFGLPGCGRLMLTINHSLSELKRLSSFDFQSLLFPESSSPSTTAKSSSSYENKLLKLYASPSGNSSYFNPACLIIGYSGSGIETIGHKLYDQLEQVYGKRGYSLEYVPLNFTKVIDYDSKSTQPNQASLHQFLHSSLKAVQKKIQTSCKSLMVFHVTLSYQYNIPIHDLKLIISTMTHVRLIQCTAVVTPENLYHYDTYNKDALLNGTSKDSKQREAEKHKEREKKSDKKVFNENSVENNETFKSSIILKGLGYSFIRALNKELVSLSNVDTVLSVTHYSSSAAGASKGNLSLTQKSNNFHEDAYLYLLHTCSNNLTDASASSSVKVIKVNPTSKSVLDDDDIEYYLQRFQRSQQGSGLNFLPLTSTETLFTLLGFPSSSHYDSLGNDGVSLNYNFIPFPKFSIQNLQTKCLYLSTETQRKALYEHQKISCWSLNNLLLLLYQLFPLAKKSFYQNISSIQYRPENVNKSLASKYSPFMLNVLTQSFFKLHMKELQDNFLFKFRDLMGSDTGSSQLYDLQLGIINLYAEVIVKNEGISYSSSGSSCSSKSQTNPYKIITIEANRGYISLKENEYKDNLTYPSSHSAYIPSGYVIIDGILTDKHWSSIEDLLNACARSYMRRREFLSVDDYLELINLDSQEKIESFHLKKLKGEIETNKVSLSKDFQLTKLSSSTVEALTKLQRKEPYVSWPLPSNLWYDGSFYIDISGNRTKVRPDILSIVDDYVHNFLNVKAKEYNDILEVLNF